MDRRSLLKWATHGLGALVGLLLGIPAVAYLLDPRNRKAADGDFKTVAKLSDLAPDKPMLAVVRDVRKDAWTLHPSDIVGKVWITKRVDGQLDVFTAICPHLGCSINFEKGSKLFVCPCHGGTWEADGHRKELTSAINPAPRGMDRLEWRKDPANPDLLQVKYQNFIQGKEVPIPKA